MVLCLQISGRELFEFNPDLVAGDDDDADDDALAEYRQQMKEEEEAVSTIHTIIRYPYLVTPPPHNNTVSPYLVTPLHTIIRYLPI